MDLEVTPEPSPEELEALRRSVASLNGHPCAAPAWWQAGVREALGEERED